MEIYILKSAACLGILFSFYKLFLENENMHFFKRFYLLASLVAAFLIPFITFTSYVEASERLTSVVMIENSGFITSETEIATNYLPIILWSLYGLGVVFFSYRFFRNLKNLILKIKHNQKLKINHIINVLVKNDVTPHTFFSYIFLNKKRFENNEIPSEVLLHEQTHALQKHSIDVLIIELIQIIFWFNPLVYLIKHAIKLNHEFLADQAVLKKGITSNNYQNLLLAFSSNATPQLANSINYSSIKKRFTLMKTETSKKSILVRSLLLLPLLAILLFSFSTTELVTKNESSIETPFEDLQEKATKSQIAEYNKLAKKYNAMSDDNMLVKKKDVQRLKTIYALMTESQRKNAEPFPTLPPPPPGTPKASKAPPVVKKGLNDMDPDMPPPPPVQRLEPLDHIVRMADENAVFFFEKKSISSNEAVVLIKNNSNLNIQTSIFEKSNPIVNISNTYAPPPLTKNSKAPLPAEDPAKIIKEMAEKGATFYAGAEKIDAEEAIILIRKIGSMKIEVKNPDSEHPIVKLIGC